MTDFNHIEQLVARVARGRQDRPDTTELALLGFGLDPFGDAERAFEGYLEDPHVDEGVKARIRARLCCNKELRRFSTPTGSVFCQQTHYL